jgi:hypothetical protein
MRSWRDEHAGGEVAARGLLLRERRPHFPCTSQETVKPAKCPQRKNT